MRCLRASVFVLSTVLATFASQLANAAEVDKSPLPIEAVRAYPNLKFDLPVYLTNAGDGSGRTFLVAQKGVIHILPKDQEGDETVEFLDISEKVLYKDNENEQGVLGLAFHPKYKENGEFFVYYSVRQPLLTTVISRFKVSKDDPNKADPASEEEIWRLTHPFWNHKGGTIVFGPDGYLYIGLGDGGAANDPHGNGQNLKTQLGSILRIDVDNKDDGKAYAIPKDNPFVGKGDAAPEIYAYGVRNIWRMAFDKKTGLLWAADVGQDIWEEIDIIKKGGNYGWNLREGMHKFGRRGVDKRDDLIEPIWEYHHDVGKSITGGFVYRGKKLPELEGKYLYADYVTGLVWGLTYDEKSGKVTANQPIKAQPLPVMSFGEDEAGEAYFLVRSGDVFTFAKDDGKE
jgi:glucose/arabinose dehydrogenase